MFEHEHFRFVQGEPKWWPGALADRGFCRDCGTPIAFQYRGAGHVTIWAGTLDLPENFKPEAHWGVESRHPWVNLHPNLPGYTTDEYLDYVAVQSGQEEQGR